MPKPSARVFRVQREQVDQTLVTALRHWLPREPSWGDVRSMVRSRHVLVNGNLCLDEGRRLKETDVIKVLPYPAAPPPRENDVVIRFLDKHLVVVEKPSGMTSVRHAEERGWSPKRKQRDPTLEDLLPRIIAKREGGERSKRNTGRRTATRPEGKNPTQRTTPVRAVHRLDRDTSGVMVFARTVPAERHLIQQFRHHTTHRRYLAIVHGAVKSQTISSNLVRDRGDGRRGSTDSPNVGKLSVTHVTVIERLGDYTLIECRLETGRTHQIRIHLSEAGHPVCGDKVYGRALFRPKVEDQSGAPRLALHAAELNIEHPLSGKALSFTTSLPRDLKEFVDRLRRSAETTG